jgi:hypothetical protein
MRPNLRARLNRWNGSTAIGRGVARLLRLHLVDGPLGTNVAGGYPLRVPVATSFVIGDVIFCRHPAAWLLAQPQRALLAHEVRHTYQYAAFGPLFWPLYFAGCAWSYALTGNAAARNAFERSAGLDGGGYQDRALRWHIADCGGSRLGSSPAQAASWRLRRHSTRR